MNVERISTIVAVLLALSVASERLVEISKGLVPHLNKRDPRTNPRGLKEPVRRAVLQVLALVCAVVMTKLAGPAIPREVLSAPEDPFAILALGLLASGGSGLWNSVLSYVEVAKNLKKELSEGRSSP